MDLFGHPSQVRTQVLVLQTCVDLRQLASPFDQGKVPNIIFYVDFRTDIENELK